MSEKHIGLVVEDDVEMTAEIRELFVAYGFEMLHAATLEAARVLVAKGGFDFCLFDMQIKANESSMRPRVENGFTLVEETRLAYPRRTDADKHLVQIVAMSGHAKERVDAVRLMQLGSNDFVVKPFRENAESLDAVIRRCLRKSGRDNHAECARLNEIARAGSSVAPPAMTAEPAAALLHSHEHRGAPLTIDAIEALVAKRADYDLFVNCVAPGRDGFVASRRDAKGKVHEGRLTQTQAALIAELVQERRPLRAAGMRCVRHGAFAAPVDSIERARRVIDVPLSRRTWRSIQTITHIGGDDTTKEFVFAPPAGLRFAVVIKA